MVHVYDRLALILGRRMISVAPDIPCKGGLLLITVIGFVDRGREHCLQMLHCFFMALCACALKLWHTCRIVMIGGGYIACEQASIYNNLGAEVHFLIRGVRPCCKFLPGACCHMQLCCQQLLTPVQELTG